MQSVHKVVAILISKKYSATEQGWIQIQQTESYYMKFPPYSDFSTLSYIYGKFQ